MFRRKTETTAKPAALAPTERVTSVLGPGTVWKGNLSGSGGVRIEGAFEGEIALKGMLVVGATGRVTCPHLRANVVIIAGAMRGDITAEKVEIRSSGRVWGDVTTAAFSTEEGAFLRGQIRMEDKVDIGVGAAAPAVSPAISPAAAPASGPVAQPVTPEAQVQALQPAELGTTPNAAAEEVAEAAAGEATNAALEAELKAAPPVEPPVAPPVAPLAAPLAAPLTTIDAAEASETPIQAEAESSGRKR